WRMRRPSGRGHGLFGLCGILLDSERAAKVSRRGTCYNARQKRPLTSDTMKNQAEAWSLAARTYEENFVDPFLPDVRNPLREALAAVAGPDRVAADLGCGLGPLLPVLARSFQHVYAVDFAPGMLDRARGACPGFDNVEFLERRLTALDDLPGKLDVSVAVNSLVMPGLEELEASLRSIHGCLKPGGKFLGIVPSIDGVHYYTMLLKDRARAAGMPEAAANKNAAAAAEHELYDF